MLGFRLTQLGEDMVLLTIHGRAARMLTPEDGMVFYAMWQAFIHGMLLTNKQFGGEA